MTRRAAGRGAARLAHALAAIGRGLRWYATSLLGEHDYARYVSHVERVHPGAVPVSEAVYWRVRYADLDARPGARCC